MKTTLIWKDTMEFEGCTSMDIIALLRRYGVSAMLSKAFPIEYKIVLDGIEIRTARANFETIEEESI
jgi:hypothetical protein